MVELIVQLVIGGILIPTVFFMWRRIIKMQDNELTHIAADIIEMKQDIKDFNNYFIEHLKGHK